MGKKCFSLAAITQGPGAIQSERKAPLQLAVEASVDRALL